MGIEEILLKDLEEILLKDQEGIEVVMLSLVPGIPKERLAENETHSCLPHQ